MKRFFALIALLIATQVQAQDYIRDEVIPPGITRDAEIAPTGESNAICVSNTGTPQPAFSLCSTLNITGKTVYYKPPEVTVATLPASHGLSIVTDGTTTTDCTVGGGSTKAWCWWNGSAWAALPGSGGSGTGDIESVAAGTGLTGGGTSGAVSLAVALSLRHTLIAGPPSPGSCQAGGEVVIDTTSVVNGITGVPYWCQAADENPVLFSALGDGIVQIVSDLGTSITASGTTQVRVEGQDGIESSINSGTTPKRLVLNYKLRGADGLAVRVFAKTADFTNQPANDRVEIVSDSASDTQNATIWGTIYGASDTALVSETIALTGVTFAPTTRTDWGNIYAVELSSAAVGTVTIREGSGNATITTIAPGNTIASASAQVIGRFAGVLTYVGTVAGLPASPDEGATAFVTDGASAGDCTTGLGATLVPCIFLSSAWTAYGVGVSDHGALTGLDDDDHAAINVKYEAAAGAASCDRNGQIQFVVADLKIYPCFSNGGNPIEIGDMIDNYVQITGDTGATTANAPDDALAIVGGTHISTAATTDTLTINASTALVTKSITFRLGSNTGSVLADAGDETDMWQVPAGWSGGITITKVTCKPDGGTPTIQLQKNDGSAADMFSSAMTCSTTPSGTDGTDGILTSFVSGENVMAAGDWLDALIVSAGGVAKRITIAIEATLN